MLKYNLMIVDNTLIFLHFISKWNIRALLYLSLTYLTSVTLAYYIFHFGRKKEIFEPTF